MAATPSRTRRHPAVTLRMNGQMTRALKNAGGLPPLDVPLPARLARILRAGWIETNQGGLMLRSFWHGQVPEGDIPFFGDMTGIEAFENHIHIEDYLDDGRPLGRRLRARARGVPHEQRPAVLRIGFAYALRGVDSAWRNHRFRCIALIGAGRPIDGVTVRFHVAREDESWVTDDLEGYRSEGVAVLKCAGPSPRSDGLVDVVAVASTR